MLKFGMIRWKNLLSTGNAFTEIDLSRPGTTLIVGANGSGKSTLIDSLSLALYGKPYRKNTKTQVVNSINQKELMIECEFQIGDSQYKVRRGMKPTLFEVWCDDEMLDQHGAMSDLQEYLERNILKMNHRSFMQVVVLGAVSFVPFMDLPASHRRDIIEDLLDLRVIGNMSTILKSRTDVTAREIRDADAKRGPLVDMIAMQDDFDRIMVEGQRKRLLDIDEKISGLEQKKSKYIESGIELAERKKRLEASISAGDPTRRRDKARMELAGLQHDKSHRADRLAFFEGKKVCPSCEQDIGDDHRKRELDKYKQEIKKLDEVIAARAETVRSLDAELTAYSSTRYEIQQVQTDINTAMRMITGIETDVASYLKERGEVEKTLASEKKDATSMKKDLATLDAARSKLYRNREVEGIVAELLKDDGVKAAIIRQYVPVINKLINKYLSALDFYVNFELDEEFNEKILSRHRDSFTYHSFSQGEKMRIDLAILFTWRAIARLRNTAATNIVIMDEVFDGALDSSGMEDFTAMMSKIVGSTNIIIISHRTDQISDKFDRVIRFEKSHDFSRIAVDK